MLCNLGGAGRLHVCCAGAPRLDKCRQPLCRAIQSLHTVTQGVHLLPTVQHVGIVARKSHLASTLLRLHLMFEMGVPHAQHACNVWLSAPKGCAVCRATIACRCHNIIDGGAWDGARVAGGLQVLHLLQLHRATGATAAMAAVLRLKPPQLTCCGFLCIHNDIFLHPRTSRLQLPAAATTGKQTGKESSATAEAHTRYKTSHRRGHKIIKYLRVRRHRDRGACAKHGNPRVGCDS